MTAPTRIDRVSRAIRATLEGDSSVVDEVFTADVLAGNKAMLRVYEKAGFPIKAVLQSGIYELIIPLLEKSGDNEKETAP